MPTYDPQESCANLRSAASVVPDMWVSGKLGIRGPGSLLPSLAGKPLNQFIELWAQSDPLPNRPCEARRVGQLISKATHRLDAVAAIFPMSIEMSQPVRLEQRRPYAYSDEEIQRILKAALAFPSPKAPLRPLSLFTIVVLASCVGLRVSEIVNTGSRIQEKR